MEIEVSDWSIHQSLKDIRVDYDSTYVLLCRTSNPCNTLFSEEALEAKYVEVILLKISAK